MCPFFLMRVSISSSLASYCRSHTTSLSIVYITVRRYISLTSRYCATFMFVEAVSSWWFMPRLRHCNCMFATLVIVHVSVRVVTWTCCRYNAVDAAFPSLDAALVMRLLKSHGSVVARCLQLQNVCCCSCDFFVAIWLVFVVYLLLLASSVVYSCWICAFCVCRSCTVAVFLCLRPLISIFATFVVAKSSPCSVIV